jgi:transposase-like protein
MRKQRTFVRYSTAFKQKVVSEIESGKFGINEARVLYDIKGFTTIQYWLHKFGKTHLLNKVIHIRMKDEKDKIKELEKQKQELESALAHAHLKIITLESTVKVLEEKTDEKLKKKTDIKFSDTVLKTKDSKNQNTL